MYFAHAVGLMYRTGKLDVRSKPLEKKRKRGRPESFPFVWPGVPQTGILLTQMLSKMRKLLRQSFNFPPSYLPSISHHCPNNMLNQNSLMVHLLHHVLLLPVVQLNHLPRRERLLDSWENPGQKDYVEARGPGSDITYNVLWLTIWQFLTNIYLSPSILGQNIFLYP